MKKTIDTLMFDIFIENPFKTYNKIKKYFLPLRPKFQISFYKSNCAKILEFNSYDLIWKDKYDSPRVEFPPRIIIHLFNYIHIYISFNIKCKLKKDYLLTEDVYWEAALWWLYYNLDLAAAVKESDSWESNGKIIKHYILREPYQRMYEDNNLGVIYYKTDENKCCI